MNLSVGIDYALGQLAVVSSQRDVLPGSYSGNRLPGGGMSRNRDKIGERVCRWITVPTFRSTIGIPIPKLWLKVWQTV
jgi:hypothetical protein